MELANKKYSFTFGMNIFLIAHFILLSINLYLENTIFIPIPDFESIRNLYLFQLVGKRLNTI